MVAYEFSTQITANHSLLIPEEYVDMLQTGAAVRVLLLVEENGHTNGHQTELDEELFSLEEVVAEIKRLPPNPNNIRHGNGLLGERLAALEKEGDPTFDSTAWFKEWGLLEEKMKQDSLEREERELKELAQ